MRSRSDLRRSTRASRQGRGRCGRSSRQYSMPASDPIAQLLAGEYIDSQTGEAVRADCRSVVIDDSLDGREVELVSALDVGRRIAIVSDTVTHAVLGARVERALRSRF